MFWHRDTAPQPAPEPDRRVREAGSLAWPELRHGAPLVLVYKHSPICGISAAALKEVQAFAESHPAVPVWRVDVVRQRALSQRIAVDLGVGHASPQVILLSRGLAVRSESHFRISRVAIAKDIAWATARHEADEVPPSVIQPVYAPHP